MINDPEEMNDISKNPEQIQRIKSLFADLLQLQKELDDPLNLRRLYESL